MNICLIGNGLTNILLAKNLFRKKIKVDLFYRKKILDNTSVRTIGITRENLKFLKKNIFDIEKISWSINQIKVFNETNQSDDNDIIKKRKHETSCTSKYYMDGDPKPQKPS